MENSLLKKFLSFSIGGYIALAIGFFTTPIVTRMLSPEQYGTYSMLNVGVNMILLVCGLGLDQGFVRHFYEEDESNRGKLLYNSLKIPLLLTLLGSILILIFKDKISLYLFGERNNFMILIFIITILLTLINKFSILAIRMAQKAKTFSILQILTQLLNFIFIILLFKKYGNNYKTLVFGGALSLITVTLVSIILEKDIWKFKGENEKISTKQLIEFSIPLTVTMALSWVFSSADKIVIKQFSSLTELGLYAAAFKIVALLNIIQTGFTTFWTPVAYERYEKNGEDKQFFQEIHEYLSFAMFLIAIILLIGKDLLILILGPKYSAASNIMPMLTLMPIMYTISETTVIGINFKKQTKYHLYISISVAIFNLLGNLYLVPKYGAKGAAISTGIAYVIFFALRTHFSLKFISYNFKLKRFYIITSLILLFSLYLTFYNDLFLKLKFGIFLIVVVIFLYRKMLNDIYIKFIKKGV
ncbi:oligosaccharide flippase family protein [Cetobacterium sp.]|uniref:oligosaccharide flippase family protein n=1 Tax=Cetobacterium sp. TaxID=2071632 RepID=UPI003F36F3EF